MKKGKIILGCILSIALFNLNSVISFGNTYVDMETHWAKDNVEYLTRHTIINGYEDNTFRAENNVSKAEIIKLVVARYADSVTSANYPEHWAMNYVRYAEQNNIIPAGMYNESNLDLPASRTGLYAIFLHA